MYLIFDTETTGLPKRDNAPVSEVDNWPRVVQIAWQLHDAEGQLLTHRNLLIKPDGFEIPYSAEKVHGISTERALSDGLPLAEALAILNESLQQTRYLVGHNVKFDINALGAEFIRSQTPGRFLELETICTMDSSTDHLKIPGGRGGRFKPPRLMELYEFLFDTQFTEAHNAAADVEATARCFFELLRTRVIDANAAGLNSEQFDRFIARHPKQIGPYGLEHLSNFETAKAEEK
ncbi:MAG: DNA polymerase III subunit alpha, partial [Bacteroidetes bacterium]